MKKIKSNALVLSLFLLLSVSLIPIKSFAALIGSYCYQTVYQNTFAIYYQRNNCHYYYQRMAGGNSTATDIYNACNEITYAQADYAAESACSY